MLNYSYCVSIAQVRLFFCFIYFAIESVAKWTTGGVFGSSYQGGVMGQATRLLGLKETPTGRYLNLFFNLSHNLRPFWPFRWFELFQAFQRIRFTSLLHFCTLDLENCDFKLNLSMSTPSSSFFYFLTPHFSSLSTKSHFLIFFSQFILLSTW